jgi:Raf kinase inhibitor-like YbhB/YbcL family protein
LLTQNQGGFAMSLKISSPAFEDMAGIPKLYTCQGKDISPPLNWSGAPENTKSFAIIADDPDAPAGTWVHWVIFNIPASSNGLGEGIKMSAKLSDGAVQANTDSGSGGYYGPCPPPGKYHRYFFKLYALDTMIDLDSSATKEDLLEAMEGHILDKAELVGRFKR